jgi:hypothetical protein
MKNKTQKLTVLRDSDEWTTTFMGEINGLQIDGQKVSDIHDLAVKVDRQNKQVWGLALIATTMALFVLLIVSGLGLWLNSHETAMRRVLLTGNRDFDVMQDQAREWRSHKRQRAWVHLKHHQGLHWDIEKQDWVYHADKLPTNP